MGNRNDDVSDANPVFEPIRARLDIKVGGLVLCEGVVYRIDQVVDFSSVIATAVETGRSYPLHIQMLQPLVDANIVRTDADLASIADDDWKVAQQRFAAIQPFVGRVLFGRHEVAAQAKNVGVDTATLYRWLKRYQAYGAITALIPQRRGWKEGRNRLSEQTVAVVEQIIRNFYLTPQRPTAQKTILEVRRECARLQITPPGASAIRARIAAITEKEHLRSRGYREKAKNKFMAVPGTFPNADFPLDVVQIDHTPVDIILVDDVHRKPIGRPWITLEMDVHTRMVMGYYLSFDPPSETSVAMCVAHAILPKEDWLILHRVDGQWPVWGMPRTIHVDNGADFRSNNFQQSCVMYGINLEFRPVKQPHYGGHIERLLGTFLQEIHDLPGTTFSSIKQREGYDAEKHATMTKSEFEVWLVTLICHVYHQRLHTSLGMSPQRKWEIGIFGNAEVQGVGLPPRTADRLTLLLDFLPHFLRTVQNFGVTIDGLTYYSEALRPWINAQDAKTKNKQQFIFRRDPRDISTVWFFDPLLKQYFSIPFADQRLPSMSIWEYRQAREKLKAEGTKSVNEPQLLQAITQLRTLVEASKDKTKKARRQAQRRSDHESKVSPAAPLATTNPAVVDKQKEPGIVDGLPNFNVLLDGDIEAFGDIA